MLDASGCDWQTRCNTMARYYNPTATPSEYYPPYSNPMGYQCQHPGYEHNNNMYAANPLMESYISSSHIGTLYIDTITGVVDRL
ncbi:hypothetical protein M8J75_003026 [Diaphorina citri]|nr:hypothetical protein M8J75_003026 [Diaphorina citri]